MLFFACIFVLIIFHERAPGWTLQTAGAATPLAVDPELKGGNIASCMATSTFGGVCIVLYAYKYIYIYAYLLLAWATQAPTLPVPALL